MNVFDEWLNEYRDDPEYLFELVSVAVAEAIVDRMASAGLTRTELAARLGISRPRVTQILAGDDNLTLKTLVAVAAALGTELTVSLSERPTPMANPSAAQRRPSKSVGSEPVHR